MDSIFVEYRHHEALVNAQLTEGTAHILVELTPEEANNLAVQLTEAVPDDVTARRLEGDDE